MKRIREIEAFPSRPKGFRTKKDSEGRGLRHGEITRYVQVCIQTLFTEILDEEERHETFKIHELTHFIRDAVYLWVHEQTGRDNYYLAPYQVAQAIRTTEIDEILFRIEGNTVRLPHSASQNIHQSAILKKK